LIRPRICTMDLEKKEIKNYQRYYNVNLSVIFEIIRIELMTVVLEDLGAI
jgi:hypothetical protein